MNIRTITWFELRRMFRSRAVVFNLFLLPMLLIFILGTALSSFFGGMEDYVPEQVKVGIIGVESGESLPSSFRTFIEAPEITKVLVPSMGLTQKEAESKLRTGGIDFAVTVPEDLDTQIFSGSKVQLKMLLGKNRTRNLIAESMFGAFMDEANSKQAQAIIVGPQVLTNSGSAENERPSYVETGKLNDQGETYSAVQYYAASMLVMFLLYSGLTASNSLFSEKENHTLYRLQSTPVSSATIFGGKILGCSVVTVMQAILIVVGSSWMYGVNWGDHVWLLMLVCVLITMTSMTIAIIVSLVTKTASTATAIIQAVVIAMTFLSGGFTPLPVDFIQALGEFTVNHWALQGILRMMLNAELSQILTCVGVLGAISLGLSAAAMIAYRKVGYHA
ncbi:MAG: ABC transporter permease [Bacillota bacterium]